jgi:predicted DNA-binding transcriptional regulator AlpA
MGDRLLDINELANLLKIPAKTIRNKLCDGSWLIQPLRIGRALRWRQSDVDRAIADLAASCSNPTKLAASFRNHPRQARRGLR